MVRPYYWPTIAKPAGASTGEWMAGCLALKWTRWLSDPGPKPGDKLREYCLSVCTRPRCKRAKRCKFAMPLALRERRHLLFKNVKALPKEFHPLFLAAHMNMTKHPKSPFARKRGQPRTKRKLTIP
jgi:hypothetical protein